MDFNTLATLRKYLSIKHHVSGRVRIKFDPALASNGQIKKLAKNRPTIPPGVNGYRINAMARSVVIEYDAGIVPPHMLEDLINATDDVSAADLLRKLDAILQSASKKEE